MGPRGDRQPEDAGTPGATPVETAADAAEAAGRGDEAARAAGSTKGPRWPQAGRAMTRPTVPRQSKPVGIKPLTRERGSGTTTLDETLNGMP